MSVTTTADLKRNEAKQKISEAIQCLHEFLDPGIWGHSDYDEEYIDKVMKIYTELRKLRREL